MVNRTISSSLLLVCIALNFIACTTGNYPQQAHDNPETVANPDRPKVARETPDWIVVGDQGSGKIILGKPLPYFQSLLGKPFMITNVEDRGCTTSVAVDWASDPTVSDRLNGIFVLFVEGSATHIEFKNERFKTDSGIAIGDRIKIGSVVGFDRLYDLPRSSSNATNGYHKHYLLHDSLNMALEILYSENLWQVNSIWIFDEQSGLSPSACWDPVPVDDPLNYVPKVY